jgi:hypothetical protein
MDAEGFNAALSALGMSQDGACRFLHIQRGSLLAYARGERDVPPITAMLLTIIVQHGLSAADARRLAGLPVENYADRRRGRVYIGRKRRFVGKPVT